MDRVLSSEEESLLRRYIELVDSYKRDGKPCEPNGCIIASAKPFTAEQRFARQLNRAKFIATTSDRHPESVAYNEEIKVQNVTPEGRGYISAIDADENLQKIQRRHDIRIALFSGLFGFIGVIVGALLQSYLGSQ